MDQSWLEICLQNGEEDENENAKLTSKIEVLFITPGIFCPKLQREYFITLVNSEASFTELSYKQIRYNPGKITKQCQFYILP